MLQTKWIFSFITYLNWFWIAGFCVFLIWQFICYIKFKQQIKRSLPLENDELRMFINHCLREKNIRRKVGILVSDNFRTPMLTGIVHPKIILPVEMQMDINTKYIINHEIIHMIHGDVWIKIVCLFIRAIHWFNPLVYLLCNQMDVWSERFCDECVTKEFNKDEKKKYALAILTSFEMTDKRIMAFNSPLNNSKISFKERIEYMMKEKKSKKVVSWIISLLLICCGMVIVYAEDQVLADLKLNLYTESRSMKVIEMIQSEDNMNSLELYTESVATTDALQGDISSIVADMGSYNWNISSGESTKTGSIYMVKGDIINLSATWKDASCDIKIGINNGTTFYYYNVSGGSFSGGIEVEKSGYYYVQVTNVGTKGITILGTYSLN